MSVRAPERRAAGYGAGSSRSQVSARASTGLGQDKRPHIARRSVGCFCRHFGGFAHIATLSGNVRRQPIRLKCFAFLHIAGLGHGR